MTPASLIAEDQMPPEVIQTSVPSICNDFRGLVEQYDWDPEIVLEIMNAESGCNPDALNNNPSTRDYSVGLMQVNIYGSNAQNRPPETTLRVPSENLAFAYELYSTGGFSHWSVCKNGAVDCGL